MPTPQEEFWAGPDGDAYTERNGEELLPAKIAFFKRALAKTHPIYSVIEFGANRGLNIIALQSLLPLAKFTGVDVNETAVKHLGRITNRIPIECPIQNFTAESFERWEQFDLSLTKGVLIHVPPADLPAAYDTLYHASKRYVLVAEYFSEEPMAIAYRGKPDLLFKRNFGAEIAARFSALKQIDGGFAGKDQGLDDLTWWLWEKTA